ncbi:hypothetical protein D3H55_15190 [Bacillus salacetis]|uniref:Uncharacterized protein n=1 Tax=Bacillus salacetis TaxID=2315464 RepID=A0A3A1QYP3_9BACI|nr:hypothetical protein [Bacillus salacetis]RIW31319.1 hypothetical protein D3H55_15190 [Bacillus salacetis]
MNAPGQNKNKTGKPTVESVLSTLSKEQLIQIISDIADKDERVENKLLRTYGAADSGEALKLCRQEMRSIVRRYKGRERFIHAREAGGFAMEMGDILQTARSTKDPVTGVDIALMIMDEAINAFQYADDSNGDLGSLISQSQFMLEEICSNLDKASDHRRKISAKLLKHTDKKIFEDWEDFRIDLLNSCFLFADDEDYRGQLRDKIETFLSEKPNGFSSEYNNERLLQLLYRLLDEYGTADEGLQFILKHMHLPSFKEQLLEIYFQEGSYQKAIDLCLEGEKKDQQYPGLVSRWKKYRYQAYKSLSMKEEQKRLGRELLFNGEFSCYYDLKELAAKNYEQFYSELKQELQEARGAYAEQVFLKLVEEENDMEALLEFVRNKPRYYIEQYAGKLEKEYKEDVLQIYKQYLFDQANEASNRRVYKEVCRKINRYKKIAGKEKQMEVIDALEELNKNKPAFLDELKKIK